MNLYSSLSESDLVNINPKGELIDERWDLLEHLGVSTDTCPTRHMMSMNRITAHSPLFAYKIYWARKLGLINRCALSDISHRYLSNLISTETFINKLATLNGQTIDAIYDQLLKLAQFGLVELHPADICNCDCEGCVFSMSKTAINMKERKIFPYSDLDFFRHLSPKAIILVGGGEPTLYNSQGHGFGDLVERLVSLLPNTRFGLVTNGVIVPNKVKWDRFDFVRISIGTMNRESYKRIKGVDFFNQVRENILWYLKSQIPMVALNFMIKRNTYDECLSFARDIYSFVKKKSPENLHKCSIQYRALIFPPNISRITGKTLESENHDVKKTQVQRFSRQLFKTKLTPREKKYLLYQTNLEDCLQGTKSHNPNKFDYCPHALLFGQIRANGNVQPCNVRSDDSIVRLGDVRSVSGMLKMVVNQFRVFLKDGTGDLCDAEHCRRHGKNLFMLNRQDQVRYPSTENSEFTTDGWTENIFNSYNSDTSRLSYFF